MIKPIDQPVLAGGLTPIKWNGSTWTDTTAEDPDWYNYVTQTSATTNGGTSKWANARTSNGSMLVWIPRYEYKIVSGYHSSTTGDIDINFIPVTQTTPTAGYIIHPAFTNEGNKRTRRPRRNVDRKI